MKKRRITLGLGVLLSVFLLAGCSIPQEKTVQETDRVFLSQGVLKNECVAEVDGKTYAFLPTDTQSYRCMLYEIGEDGMKVVCGREDCAHENQGTLADPCYAYSNANLWLQGADGKLYAGSRNGEIGVVQFSVEGEKPTQVLAADKMISTFLVEDGQLFYAQMDQTFSDQESISAESGYRLCSRWLDGSKSDEVLYEKSGVVGYISSISLLDGKLLISEVFQEDGKTKQRIVQMSPSGGGAQVFCEDAGGAAPVLFGSGFVVIKQDAHNRWSVVALDETGMEKDVWAEDLPICSLLVLDDVLLVDSGHTLDTEERKLYVFDEQGNLINAVEIPVQYSPMLGADADTVWFWSGEEASASIEKITWKQAAIE